jgi:uncharacterized protein (TIGR02145 family)
MKIFKPLIILYSATVIFISCEKKNDKDVSCPTCETDPVCSCIGCETDIIFDIDSNAYKTIKICDQWWMAKNLGTTKLNDGTPIQYIVKAEDWKTASTAAYCWYNHDESSYKTLYGALYNFYTIETEKLCPVGWHVPSDSDWIKLASHLGDSDLIDLNMSVAGGALKEKDTIHWVSPNIGATDTAGFGAIPAGFRSGVTGEFYGLGTEANWHSTYFYNEMMKNYIIINNKSILGYGLGGRKQNGFSVRCVKD